MAVALLPLLFLALVLWFFFRMATWGARVPDPFEDPDRLAKAKAQHRDAIAARLTSEARQATAKYEKERDNVRSAFADERADERARFAEFCRTAKPGQLTMAAIHDHEARMGAIDDRQRQGERGNREYYEQTISGIRAEAARAGVELGYIPTPRFLFDF